MSRFTPKETYRKISDISLDYLKNDCKIKGLIFDFDGTLQLKCKISKSTFEFIKEAKESGLKVAVVSNNIHINEFLLKKMNIIAIKKFALKPFKKPLLDMARRMKLKPEQIAFVGNNRFTDIFGSNRAGMYSIYIQNNINGFFHKRKTKGSLEEKGINKIDD
jgi:HAD superfamily phosphatase (TIGR01668 family)